MTLNIDPQISKIKKLAGQLDKERSKITPFLSQLTDLENQTATAREAIAEEMRVGELLTEATTKRLLDEISDKDLEQLQRRHTGCEIEARKAERQLEAIARAKATIEQRRSQQQAVVDGCAAELDDAKSELANAIFAHHAAAYLQTCAVLAEHYRVALSAAELVRVVSGKFVSTPGKVISLPALIDPKLTTFEIDTDDLSRRSETLLDQLNKAGAQIVAKYPAGLTPIEKAERQRAAIRALRPGHSPQHVGVYTASPIARG